MKRLTNGLSWFFSGNIPLLRKGSLILQQYWLQLTSVLHYSSFFSSLHLGGTAKLCAHSHSLTVGTVQRTNRYQCLQSFLKKIHRGKRTLKTRMRMMTTMMMMVMMRRMMTASSNPRSTPPPMIGTYTFLIPLCHQQTVIHLGEFQTMPLAVQLLMTSTLEAICQSPMEETPVIDQQEVQGGGVPGGHHKDHVNSPGRHHQFPDPATTQQPGAAAG